MAGLLLLDPGSGVVSAIVLSLVEALLASDRGGGLVAKERHPTFLPLEVDQDDHDCDPVEDVAEHGAEICFVRPSKDGIEDLPNRQQSTSER